MCVSKQVPPLVTKTVNFVWLLPNLAYIIHTSTHCARVRTHTVPTNKLNRHIKGTLLEPLMLVRYLITTSFCRLQCGSDVRKRNHHVQTAWLLFLAEIISGKKKTERHTCCFKS
jgi:hypothetical protein